LATEIPCSVPPDRVLSASSIGNVTPQLRSYPRQDTCDIVPKRV
jgi:hypothetical protein